MMWTIIVILAVMWIFGMITSTTLGGYLHILLIVAVIVFVADLLRARRNF